MKVEWIYRMHPTAFDTRQEYGGKSVVAKVPLGNRSICGRVWGGGGRTLERGGRGGGE